MFVFIFPVLYSQDNVFVKPINIHINNRSVYYTLTQIEKQTGYFFSYNSDIIDEDKIISISFKNYLLKPILDSLLNDTTLLYKVVGNQIIIYRDNTEITSSRVVQRKLPGLENQETGF